MKPVKKVLAFVEGVSESGGTRERDRVGAVGVLIQRVLGSDVEVEFDKVSNVDHRGVGGPFGRIAKKAIACMIRARGKNFDAAVFLVDLDKTANSDRINQLDRAQDNLAPNIPRAFGVAIMEFEAWLLADEVAIRKGIGELYGT